MQEHLRIIDRLIEQRDIKKAEAQIAKSLRATLPLLERIELLIRRSRTRLLAGRPDDALSDLMETKACDPHIYESDGLQELVADSYFARFELASVGFADRNDAQVALGIYQRLLSQSPDYENTGWIHYQMGRVQMTGGEIEGAVSSFQAALLSPSHVRGLTAYCYERLGFIAFYEWRSLDKALTFQNKAVDTYPA
ncbi:MAG: hypothetical protein K8I82_01185, partial [Anaerolineae bacterium]|nr:hypothetical protein [Anaerolineae bacterium]